jgi:hypothetical protein
MSGSCYFASSVNGSRWLLVTGRDMDATRATENGAHDPHRNIPKDGNGDPLYLVLPDDLRARYERKLAACEAAWRETKDPFMFAEACSLAFYHRQPLPPWLHEAAWAVAAGSRGKSHAKRALEAAVHLMRYLAVQEAKAKGVTWLEAYNHAAATAACAPEAAKASYAMVKKDLRARRTGRYHTVKTPRHPR